MLTSNQEKYLLTIPKDKIAIIKPFASKSTAVANEIISSIKETDPRLDVLFMGASALKIAGQGDLDIYICSKAQDFPKYLPKLKSQFGETASEGNFVEWKFTKDGFEVEMYLTDCSEDETKEQIRIFEILKNNPKLLKKYEQMKLNSNGKSYREYQRRKYEFYNRLLTSK